MKQGSISIKGLKVPVFIATSEEEQMQGLMFIDPPFPAMIFLYKEARVNKFWMDNVKAPLDIIFCRNNRIINICRGEAFSQNLIGEDHLSDCIIELPAGAAVDFDLSLGDEIPFSIS